MYIASGRGRDIPFSISYYKSLHHLSLNEQNKKIYCHIAKRNFIWVYKIRHRMQCILIESSATLIYFCVTPNRKCFNQRAKSQAFSWHWWGPCLLSLDSEWGGWVGRCYLKTAISGSILGCLSFQIFYCRHMDELTFKYLLVLIFFIVNIQWPNYEVSVKKA